MSDGQLVQAKTELRERSNSLNQGSFRCTYHELMCWHTGSLARQSMGVQQAINRDHATVPTTAS